MNKVDVLPLLSPQMRAAVEKSQALYAEMSDLPSDPIEAMRVSYNRERRFWNAVEVPGIAAEDLVLEPANLPPFRMRFFRPSARRGDGALVYLHGGGFILGNLDTHDRVMRLHADRAGLTVIGIDYALAPEHRFPVALEQSLAAVRYLAQHGPALGVDPARLALGGDSAGANLSVAAALTLNAQEPGRIKAALLYYGAFGLNDSVSQRLYGSALDGLTRDDLNFYRGAYMGETGDRDDPRHNVLAADLSGMPPALILACALDPLLDDSLALARMLEARAIGHELVVYDGVLHSFLHLSRMVDAAGAAIDHGARWLHQAFGARLAA